MVRHKQQWKDNVVKIIENNKRNEKTIWDSQTKSYYYCCEHLSIDKKRAFIEQLMRRQILRQRICWAKSNVVHYVLLHWIVWKDLHWDASKLTPLIKTNCGLPERKREREPSSAQLFANINPAMRQKMGAKVHHETEPNWIRRYTAGSCHSLRLVLRVQMWIVMDFWLDFIWSFFLSRPQ